MSEPDLGAMDEYITTNGEQIGDHCLRHAFSLGDNPDPHEYALEIVLHLADDLSWMLNNMGTPMTRDQTLVWSAVALKAMGHVIRRLNALQP